MIERFYIDNFRGLSNFELKLDEANLLLGPNGTGKTSVLEALAKIRSLVTNGTDLSREFASKDLSTFQNSNRQKFEIRLRIGADTYRYALTVEHHSDRRRSRINEETLEHDGRPLFEFRNGDAQLYHDDYLRGPSYPFDWSRSGLGTLNARRGNEKLTRFKRELKSCVIVKPCPPLFETESRAEDDELTPAMENFVNWYRHAAQENMGQLPALFKELGGSLPHFHSISLAETGEEARILKARFRTESTSSLTYGFHQLSDGQRALIALYSLIFLVSDQRRSLFIDEPDNYLALREIQPWLTTALDQCGESIEQLILISHHPVLIDHMAGASGRWFSSQIGGPIRVTNEPDGIVEGLTLSETIARGWDE